MTRAGDETGSRQGSAVVLSYCHHAQITEQSRAIEIHRHRELSFPILWKSQFHLRPLTNLTQQDMPFNWSEVQDDAFRKASQVISSAPVLQYYGLHKPILLQVDANWKSQPVAFSLTSCSMNVTERYSQIEKECLAICNVFTKFDQWLFGKSDIKVHTDHQPLETIIKKPLDKASARL